MEPTLPRHGVWLCALACAIIDLAGCSKSEPPTPASKTPPAPIVATPAPEPAVTPAPAAEPSVEQHIPGTPEAKAFVAANAVTPHKNHATHVAQVRDPAYARAYRNASRADSLLHRHAYVVSFDDAAATNAVPLNREYR